MGEDILLLIIGFLLTTVLGGGLVHYYQNRAWNHQYRMNRADVERQTATAVFEQLSTAMDKRLYRMRLVRWRLEEDQPSIQRIEETMDGYRAVLQEWNDNLNRNSALVERYFGSRMRVRLEEAIYERFAGIGRKIEGHYHARLESGNSVKLPDVGQSLDILSHNIYSFNLTMIRMIQSGEVGLQVGGEDSRQSLRARGLWQRWHSLFRHSSSNEREPAE